MLERPAIRRLLLPALGLSVIVLAGCDSEQRTMSWAQDSPVLEPTRTFAAGEINDDLVRLGMHDVDDAKRFSAVVPD